MIIFFLQVFICNKTSARERFAEIAHTHYPVIVFCKILHMGKKCFQICIAPGVMYIRHPVIKYDRSGIRSCCGKFGGMIKN